MLLKPSYLRIECSLFFQVSPLLPQLSMYPLKAHILVRAMWLILCRFSTNELHLPIFICTHVLLCSASQVTAMLKNDFTLQVYGEYSGVGDCTSSLLHHSPKASEANEKWVHIVGRITDGASSSSASSSGRGKTWEETIAGRISAYPWIPGAHTLPSE